MPTFISLLRAVNVGKQQIRMEALRSVYEAAGFTNVRSYVQSGNIVFEAAKSDPASLSNQIQDLIQDYFGFKTPVILRSAAELKHVLENNPFLKNRDSDPAYLHVTFLSTKPEESATAIKKPSTAADEFVLAGREVYIHCPGGYGRTKLNNTFFEKKLGVTATTRNWKTVNALYQMASEE